MESNTVEVGKSKNSRLRWSSTQNHDFWCESVRYSEFITVVWITLNFLWNSKFPKKRSPKPGIYWPSMIRLLFLPIKLTQFVESETTTDSLQKPEADGNLKIEKKYKNFENLNLIKNRNTYWELRVWGTVFWSSLGEISAFWSQKIFVKSKAAPLRPIRRKHPYLRLDK